MGGEKRHGIDCLYMRNDFQKGLVICVCLEIVSKINIYCRLLPVSVTFNHKEMKSVLHVYKGKDAFLRVATSFSNLVCYKVLPFVSLTTNRVSWVQAE